MPLRYAVHAYAWTNSWSNATLDLIDKAKALGFDLIEIPLMELDKIDAEAIKTRLRRVGLGVCCSTACAEDNDISSPDAQKQAKGISYLKACVKATHDMGATTLSGVLYSAIGGKIDGMPDEGYWQRAAQGLKEVARYAQDYGVTLGIEPINRYESFLVNTCAQALKLKDLINEPNIAIHPDAYHMNIEEQNFYEATKSVSAYLCHFHLSESHRGTPGTGVVDWRGIYRALAEANYEGVVGLESFSEVSPAMRAATCIWRELAPSSDALLRDGLAYLKALEHEVFAA